MTGNQRTGDRHSGVEDTMVEIVFRPPIAILIVAIAVVAVGAISVLLKKSELPRKIITAVVVVALAGGIVLVLYRSTTLTVDGDGLRTTGLSGVDLSWDEVQHAYSEANLAVSKYRPTVRTRGVAIGDYRTGRFLLSNGNGAQVLMERSDQALVIVTAGLTYLFAPSEIDVLFDAVNQHRSIPQAGE
jgi:PH (Pleckstrin Homology) domain-containing protein